MIGSHVNRNEIELVLIHEFCHASTGAKDATPAWNAEMNRVADLAEQRAQHELAAQIRRDIAGEAEAEPYDLRDDFEQWLIDDPNLGFEAACALVADKFLMSGPEEFDKVYPDARQVFETVRAELYGNR